MATGFFNPAMPLLRYDTGDLAVPLETPCPCGRALPAVREVQGRFDDLLVTPSGRVVQELDRVVMAAKHIRESQVVPRAAIRTTLKSFA